MAEPFRTQRLVEFHDTDMAGIMHFASFFQYMESAEHEFIRSLGLSVHSQIAGKTISFPRVAASCDFKSPVRCEEVLDIAILVTRLGSKSISYSFEMTSAGKEIAAGNITCVCCQVEPGEDITSVPIPAEIREKLQTYLA
ncbi:acyl-CoA thioesterase [Bythopirellula polymerisocia]|uniref:1,4-dihydroxy-2-naphthoyl-CoA hydrolase n=1 Tax=Bythopirellula polymerisocia TaxID=2528003 RepID=A0A5C6CIC1_9BACT|nr:thioesterase family protein [Bythopirellula polymerisocia]TWU23835.1 1,4-dihydroxy-2-naphthoyl-CoA hydrolase [Bythopirellula polymerisocia]